MARKTRQEMLEDYIEKIDKCRRWRDQENFEVYDADKNKYC